MKSIRMLGLCLVAAFAMSAVAAVSASAALPEYTTCVAAPGGAGTGAYTTAACTTKDTDTDENFERVTPKFPVALTATSGVSTLEGESGTKITCKSSKSVGAITGPKTDENTTTFEKCESKSLKATCQNNGSKEGEIKTNPLNSELGYINKAKKEVGDDFTPKAGTNLAEFECGGKGLGPNFIFAEGSTIGKLTPPNKMATVGKLVLKGNGKGENVPNKFENEPKDTLTTKICTQTGCTSEGSAQIQTATITTAEALEALTEEKTSP